MYSKDIVKNQGGVNMNGFVVGKRIKSARESRQLTQAELGRQMETDGKYISRIENGKSLPSIDRLVQMAYVLGCSCDYIIGDMEALGDVYECQLIENYRPVWYSAGDMVILANEFFQDINKILNSCMKG